MWEGVEEWHGRRRESRWGGGGGYKRHVHNIQAMREREIVTLGDNGMFMQVRLY